MGTTSTTSRGRARHTPISCAAPSRTRASRASTSQTQAKLLAWSASTRRATSRACSPGRIRPRRLLSPRRNFTYQGEIVAAVLAETKSQAADAANLIQVEYQDLPAVMDLEKALQKGSPKSHVDGPDNVCWDFTYTGPDITEAAFKEADVVVKERILQNRLAPVPMEPRGVSADYEGFDKKLTIWMSSQNPHFIRLFVSGAMGLKESQVRVIS
ncbi:MAG: xanthine dehydrogenase family protein molybdopterin-binding subunit, partial [Chloroflexi bacterium]